VVLWSDPIQDERAPCSAAPARLHVVDPSSSGSLQAREMDHESRREHEQQRAPAACVPYCRARSMPLCAVAAAGDRVTTGAQVDSSR
jgi:hypothetical protein